MTLTPTGYRPRVIDAELARCLKLFGAVEIRGPKWCGKTWAGLNQSVDEVYIADPSDGYVTRRLARLDPDSVLQGDHPLRQAYGMRYAPRWIVRPSLVGISSLVRRNRFSRTPCTAEPGESSASICGR